MNIGINKVFLKELAKLPAKERLKVEKFLFEEILNYKSPFQIPNFEKLKGYRNYYKIRFGDYRAGLKIENDTLYFERILHRKDIYKFYP
ncbi:MAG: type II toxin-antitoxin system RelE/ParE family toxin [Bacteroidota bacterium]|nr:type II toxin-antitoxin system RelE/ParE family toxin [Bacteroidota bacterium]